MSDSGKTGGRPKRLRFLLDRPSQTTVAYHIVAVLAGVGLLYAVAVYFLLGSDLVSEGTLQDTRLLLLGVQAAYFLLGGAILLVVTLLLTHRFAGPAYVMQIAIAKMRRGDYDVRLTTRSNDFHKGVTEELRHFGEELRAREASRAALLDRLEHSLENGETSAAGELIAQLRAAPSDSPRSRRKLPGLRPQREARRAERTR